MPAPATWINQQQLIECQRTDRVLLLVLEAQNSCWQAWRAAGHGRAFCPAAQTQRWQHYWSGRCLAAAAGIAKTRVQLDQHGGFNPREAPAALLANVRDSGLDCDKPLGVAAKVADRATQIVHHRSQEFRSQESPVALEGQGTKG